MLSRQVDDTNLLRHQVETRWISNPLGYDDYDVTPHSGCPLPDTVLSFPELVLALGIRLIGLKPLFSGTTGAGGAAPVPPPRILATLLPKKLPIPLPIPPSVERISAKGGLVGPVGAAEADVEVEEVEVVTGELALPLADCGSLANFSLRILSASSRSFILVAILFRAPSKALNSDEDPVANADEPAANALLSTSRVGASD